MTTTFCSNCGQALPSDTDSPDRQPCSHCGSIDRHYHVEIQDQLEFRESVKYEMVDSTLPSNSKRKKTRVKASAGYEWSRGYGKLVYKEQTIDRRNDLYREFVMDPDSRAIIHQCEEPLSEHWGHGSAKFGDNR